jgi:transcription-repair coupling factor (superfamily II helicase)
MAASCSSCRLSEANAGAQNLQPFSINPFYPAWEVLPHEGKLPHADTISDRLQTLVALSKYIFSEGGAPRRPNFHGLVVTNVTALLQKTFPPEMLRNRTRVLQRGDKIAPLDLIEWLEEQSYEPEAQVTQKGEIALRGGILDVWPLTSPWPARLEFFGDEIESLRHFDPLTQISRGEISGLTIPPAGELGILKGGIRKSEVKSQNQTGLATLARLSATGGNFSPCEPEQLAVSRQRLRAQIPAADPFLISWEDFLTELNRHGYASRLDLMRIKQLKVRSRGLTSRL